MWMYTNDPVLMRKSPEVLAICTWLETPIGHRVAHTAVSMVPVSALALTASGRHSLLAMKLISGGIITLCILMIIGFTTCGRSLMGAIDGSLLLQKQQTETREMAQRMRVAGARKDSNAVQLEKGQRSGDPSLLKTKRKVQMVVIIADALCFKVAVILVFAICTKYGGEAPLLMFLVPMILLPLIWNLGNVQLHAGRSKLRRSGSISRLPPRLRRASESEAVLGIIGAHFRNQQQTHVVPTEMRSISP
ncbi:unnamed protein product [Hapterophycus canaliculatus]